MLQGPYDIHGVTCMKGSSLQPCCREAGFERLVWLQVVSLLAQGLADQAAATQHPPAPQARAAPGQAANKPQQAPWFSNLPHINTVRRVGKAGNEGNPK